MSIDSFAMENESSLNLRSRHQLNVQVSRGKPKTGDQSAEQINFTYLFQTFCSRCKYGSISMYIEEQFIFKKHIFIKYIRVAISIPGIRQQVLKESRQSKSQTLLYLWHRRAPFSRSVTFVLSY